VLGVWNDSVTGEFIAVRGNLNLHLAGAESAMICCLFFLFDLNGCVPRESGCPAVSQATAYLLTSHDKCAGISAALMCSIWRNQSGTFSYQSAVVNYPFGVPFGVAEGQDPRCDALSAELNSALRSALVHWQSISPAAQVPQPRNEPRLLQNLTTWPNITARSRRGQRSLSIAKAAPARNNDYPKRSG
jgi:hypothetical protein